MNYIFDIDNTLADCSHRSHYLALPSYKELSFGGIDNKIKPDWDSFYSHIS